MSLSIVEINDVSFAYNGRTVLQNVNMDIKKGAFIAMIGPNGGGKTTLLKLILGLLKPDSGKVRVMGKTAVKASGCIGYVPQDVHINRNFPITVIDVVLMGRLKKQKRWSPNYSKDRHEAMAALNQMKIARLADRKIGELSDGQRQRVFIARALATQPQLMLLDEPTASIDTKGQTDFFELLKEINQEITILVVSHDLIVISRYVKSIACVNKVLHYHNNAQITEDMLKTLYPCNLDASCQVEFLSHRRPAKFLKEQKESIK